MLPSGVGGSLRARLLPNEAGVKWCRSYASSGLLVASSFLSSQHPFFHCSFWAPPCFVCRPRLDRGGAASTLGRSHGRGHPPPDADRKATAHFESVPWRLLSQERKRLGLMPPARVDFLLPAVSTQNSVDFGYTGSPASVFAGR